MRINYLSDETETPARKIDWPLMSVRLEPKIYDAVLEHSRLAGKKPAVWVRDLITASLSEAA